MWRDKNMLRMQADSTTEPRFALIGRIDGKVWVVIVTYRGNVVRIISARRARKGEVKMYEETVPISAEEFDAKFDAGEDISMHLDWISAVRINHTKDAEELRVMLPKSLVQHIRDAACAAQVPTATLLEGWLTQHLPPPQS